MALTTIDRTLSPGRLTPADLAGDSRRLRADRIARNSLLLAALVSLVVSALIVFTLIDEALGFLGMIDLGQLSGIGWFPQRGVFDVGTLLVSTLIITGLAMLFATPVGLGGAIYLSEYARPRTRRVIKPIIEVLAGIPSVVIGYFALTVITPDLIQPIFSSAGTFNMVAAGIGVGIMIVPLVASVSEDAMRSVPNSLREASYGLGAQRVSTSLHVVLPASISGLVAALILAISRAMGETLVVTIAAGGSGGALFSTDPLSSGLTMTAAMASQTTTDQSTGGAAYQSMFFVGMLLFVITLSLNLVANRFVRRVRRKY